MRASAAARRRTISSVRSRLPFSTTRISTSAPSGAIAASMCVRAVSTTAASLCTGRTIVRPAGGASDTLELLVIDVVPLVVRLGVEPEVRSRQIGPFAVVVHQDVPLAAGPRRNPLVHAPGVEQ